jgi:hypothetical protein
MGSQPVFSKSTERQLRPYRRAVAQIQKADANNFTSARVASLQKFYPSVFFFGQITDPNVVGSSSP